MSEGISFCFHLVWSLLSFLSEQINLFINLERFQSLFPQIYIFSFYLSFSLSSPAQLHIASLVNGVQRFLQALLIFLQSFFYGFFKLHNLYWSFFSCAYSFFFQFKTLVELFLWMSYFGYRIFQPQIFHFVICNNVRAFVDALSDDTLYSYVSLFLKHSFQTYLWDLL